MSEETTLTLEAFRQARESGVDLYAQEETQQAQEDAAPEGSVESVEDEGRQDGVEGAEGLDNASEEATEDDEPHIPKEHQTAWQKRAERERRKGAEEAEVKIREEYESKLNPYKAFFDRLGIDPQRAMEAIERNQIQQEAQNLAYTNGWTEEQTQMYIDQQELKRQVTENNVSLRIYELGDSSDYPGIKQMKGPITEFIRANPRATVEQAYWAVGGQSLAQQLKREAEQREIAKRTQTKRTVVTDAPTDMKGPEPLPEEAIAFMRRTGMSEQEVRMMLKDEGPKNLEEYRKMKRKG